MNKNQIIELLDKDEPDYSIITDINDEEAGYLVEIIDESHGILLHAAVYVLASSGKNYNVAWQKLEDLSKTSEPVVLISMLGGLKISPNPRDILLVNEALDNPDQGVLTKCLEVLALISDINSLDSDVLSSVRHKLETLKIVNTFDEAISQKLENVLTILGN